MNATFIALAGAMFVCAPVAHGGVAQHADRCGGLNHVIHVATDEHLLRLCEAGRTAGVYAVTLGSEGSGKRREGDGRTPVGRYPLRTPRASTDFRVFIAIGYPTAEQRAQGFTGSAIGVHGPPRALARLRMGLPAAVLAMDWTRGCIAVATDAEIDAIADWVTRSGAREILIE